jgi:catechol 2,3-dioxygenase-like lactoylglutathione lyase family enzyme
MFEALDHIEVVVRDVERYVEFFRPLGLTVLRRTAHHGVSAELAIPGQGQPILEIHQASMQEVIGINHLAFRVENVTAAAARIQALGIKLEGGPMMAKSTGRFLANFRDPDGLRLQIVEAPR